MPRARSPTSRPARSIRTERPRTVMKKTGIGVATALALAIGFAPPCIAADGGAPLPSSVSQSRLERIDALLQRYVDEERIAGAVALVLKDGQPIYERAVGWADR